MSMSISMCESMAAEKYGVISGKIPYTMPLKRTSAGRECMKDLWGWFFPKVHTPRKIRKLMVSL